VRKPIGDLLEELDEMREERAKLLERISELEPELGILQEIDKKRQAAYERLIDRAYRMTVQHDKLLQVLNAARCLMEAEEGGAAEFCEVTNDVEELKRTLRLTSDIKIEVPQCKST